MSPTRGDAEARRGAILDAALRVFGQYGFRRTSMDDIAREAGIGKGTIYLSFGSKDEVFQGLSEALTERMLAGASAAARLPVSTADRLAAMSAAWFGTYVETIWRSPHASELMDAKHRLVAELVAESSRRYKELVRDVVAEGVAAGELDLEAAGLTADIAAELLIAGARGLESSASSPGEYLGYLDALVRVMVAGLQPGRENLSESQLSPGGEFVSLSV
jgi:AcrR family transcriptional regulator